MAYRLPLNWLDGEEGDENLQFLDLLQQVKIPEQHKHRHLFYSHENSSAAAVIVGFSEYEASCHSSAAQLEKTEAADRNRALKAIRTAEESSGLGIGLAKSNL